MLDSNMSNQKNHNENDTNRLSDYEKFWNKYEKKIISNKETYGIDIFDRKVWTRELLSKLIEQYKEKWILKDYRKTHPMTILGLSLKNFDINSTDDILIPNLIDEKINTAHESIASLRGMVEIMNMNENRTHITREEWENMSDDLKNQKIYTEEWEKYKKIVNRIAAIMFYCGEFLLNFGTSIEASNPNNDNTGNNIHRIIKRKWINLDDEEHKDNESVHQKLLKAIYDICQLKGYTKYNDLIYRPVFTSNNDYTYSAERVYDIDEFVEVQISRDNNPSLWDLAHQKAGIISNIKSVLKTSVDSSLPRLIKNRNLFSFNNGVYELKSEIIDDNGKKTYTDKFYPYNGKERKRLRPGTVSCKYFDMKMEYKHYDDWYDIPTPNIQKILDLQYKSHKEYEDIAKWMYRLMGRLFYAIGDLDGWQVIPFMVGLAGTGKGTTIKAVQKFFAPEDVGVLGNDGQKDFAAAALVGKLIYVAPEIKGDISLPQALFQSMISGEDVSINIKHKTAQTLTWDVPGMLAGNEVPNWTDNSGSIGRRLIIFKYAKKVPTKMVDPNLWDKIADNLPNIIRKCNLAYLDAVNQWANYNIWNVLPHYFIERQRELSEQTNDVIRFLRSSNVVYNPNFAVSEKEFKKCFIEFAKDNGRKTQYKSDKLIEPLQTLSEEFGMQIKMVKIDRRNAITKKLAQDRFEDKTGVWFRGMAIQDSSMDVEEEEEFVEFLKQIEKI